MIKSVRDIDAVETCACGSTNTSRTIAKSQSFSGAADWDNAHYSPALGRVVRSNKEARRIAKERGLIEVGNEPVEKIHKKYDTEREMKAEQGYTDIVKSLTNLGEIAS